MACEVRSEKSALSSCRSKCWQDSSAAIEEDANSPCPNDDGYDDDYNDGYNDDDDGYEDDGYDDDHDHSDDDMMMQT